MEGSSCPTRTHEGLVTLRDPFCELCGGFEGGTDFLRLLRTAGGHRNGQVEAPVGFPVCMLSSPAAPLALATAPKVKHVVLDAGALISGVALAGIAEVWARNAELSVTCVV